MNRKTECESIVLTRSERRLLHDIARHPRQPHDWKTVYSLRKMGLIAEDTSDDECDALGQPVPLGTYSTTDFYKVYCAYKRERAQLLALKSIWLPIVVSLITTLTITGLQWLWPLLTQWLSRFL